MNELVRISSHRRTINSPGLKLALKLQSDAVDRTLSTKLGRVKLRDAFCAGHFVRSIR
jgi:hypothetical protein